MEWPPEYLKDNVMTELQMYDFVVFKFTSLNYEVEILVLCGGHFTTCLW